MKMMKIAGLVLVTLSWVGCTRLPSDARWLRANQLGDPHQARSVGLMEGTRRSEINYLPQGQDTSTVQDELALTRFDGTEVCVDMLVRTASSIDRAVADGELWLNGRRFTGLQRMNVIEGETSRRDCPVVRQVNVALSWGGRSASTCPSRACSPWSNGALRCACRGPMWRETSCGSRSIWAATPQAAA